SFLAKAAVAWVRSTVYRPSAAPYDLRNGASRRGVAGLWECLRTSPHLTHKVKAIDHDRNLCASSFSLGSRTLPFERAARTSSDHGRRVNPAATDRSVGFSGLCIGLGSSRSRSQAQGGSTKGCPARLTLLAARWVGPRSRARPISRASCACSVSLRGL